MKRIGIYKILNLTSKDIYIGSSVDVFRRFKTHKQKLKNNNHHSIVLQRAWNKYGKDSFQFQIIEYCTKDDLIIREQYYLDKLKPKYNILTKAYSSLNRKIPTEEILIRRKAAKGKKVYQFDNKNNCINEFNSVKEASRFLKCGVSQIFGVLNGNRKTCKGYYWSYNKNHIIKKPLTGSRVYKNIIAINKLNSDDRINFTSIKEACNYVKGFSQNICYCIKNNNKTYKGYYWIGIKN